MTQEHIRLHIPGPVEVSPDTYAAMAAPMIGHRGKDFQALYAGIQPRLQELFQTRQPVFLSTSSAWGVMEGAIRNLVIKKVLCCCSGAFSDKWVDVAARCGKQAEALQFEWGEPVDPAALEARLATGEFDTVTFIHNETSTGVMNPLEEIAAAVRKFDDVLLVVDTVSSFSVVPTAFDELGLGVMLTGSQKALALPPGLALFAVSEAAYARAERVNDRGYYFDFIEFRKNQEKDMTPSTPCIATIHGLRHQLNRIFTEGVANRHARHEHLNAKVARWVESKGFEFFAPEGYRSKALTCVKNNLGIDVAALQKRLRDDHRLALDGGYGKIKGTTFRLSNMGDETDETIDNLLAALDDALGKL
ncbi:MAG: alanine--glyoxylate aminotransferase family protein [Akkermansiaceae bacterium]|nr:alanine--glyoxylate aminotransferase family protein [Akkermansiaceae bacterium]MCP5549715.1 alanine--glyoxylate aminotransferase family protein [Akkermansiaceae bacterium]